MVKKNFYSLKKIMLACVIIFCASMCKEVYDPHVQSPQTGYLVVEGFINSNGFTNITLTRTTKLVDSVNIAYEYGARVTIEGDDNESYDLRDNGYGSFKSDSLVLSAGVKYRLHITTSDGKEYASDLSEVKYTPAIDSISWLRDDQGVHLYVNTHDEPTNTKYYKWTYVETWEYNSPYFSSLNWVYDGDEPVDYQLSSYYSERYTCWHTIYSSNILLGSTERLNANKIYLLLHNIEAASEKLSVRYSILVTQNSISHDAYMFYEKLKKNTEQLGSVFDAQPSELSGNIHCLSNPAETVIGFVETSTAQQKRIFIIRSQVPDWGYQSEYCEVKKIPRVRDSIRIHGAGLLPFAEVGFQIVGAVSPECVDCTLRGGTNIKPDFWP